MSTKLEAENIIFNNESIMMTLNVRPALCDISHLTHTSGLVGAGEAKVGMKYTNTYYKENGITV